MSDQILFRVLAIDTTRADERTRRVDASLSSEEPVSRFFGHEVLSHQPDAIDMSRAADGLPFLFSHDPEQVVGIAERLRIEAGKLRASLRFASTAKGDELWSLVRDGILKGVSIGYRILRMEQTGETEDGESIYVATQWLPVEASLVSVPADHTVGVGRASSTLTLNTRNSKMSEPNIQPGQDLAKAERERCRNISAIGDMYPDNLEIQAASRRAIADGTSLADFQRIAPSMVSRAPHIPVDDTPVTQIGLTQREVKRFSILKAVSAMVQNDWRHAQFELEASRAVEDQLGRSPKGLFVPSDVLRGGKWTTRAVPMDTSNSTLVATDHLAGDFFGALHQKSIVFDAGCTVLPGLVGNVSIPGFTSGASFGWLAEDADSADTEPSTTAITLSPKTVSGSVPITRRLLKQSSPAIEMLIRDDLIKGAASAIDAAALAADGTSNTPTGILNTTAVNTSLIASAGSPTWGELVNFETQVAIDKALGGPLAYCMHPGVVGNAKTTGKDSGSGLMLIENGLCNGYRVFSTTNVGSNGIIFGDWSGLLIGFWGVLDINVDVATKAASGGIVLRAFQDCDVAVRRAVGFCINA